MYLIAAGAGVEVDIVQLQELHTEGALGGLISGAVQTGVHGEAAGTLTTTRLCKGTRL